MGADKAEAPEAQVTEPAAAAVTEPPAADVTTPPEAETAGEPASAPALEGDVTVIVQVTISGTREGEPWPAIGDELTLPADEAEQYLKFGYVRLPE